jgi:hypothetical protein
MPAGAPARRLFFNHQLNEPIMTNSPQPKFKLGQVVITGNAAQQLDTIAVHEALRRHAAGDWGDICPDDACENELSLKEGFRLLSAYGTAERRFWVITEADRSATTILMPEDY